MTPGREQCTLGRMFRPLLRVSLLSCLAATACKGKEKASTEPNAESAKPTASTAVKTVTPTPEQAASVQPDPALIDATLEKLGDATIASAASKGLPQPQGELGIACGNEATVTGALQHISFADEPLKLGKGFLFRDVCIGWRPYITPVTEIYWMISAGAPAEGEEVMPVRRCLQVLKTDTGFAKAEIMDGPCLTMHRQE